MGLINMIKSYLIAGAIFALALVASAFMIKRKQAGVDNVKAKEAVQKELEKISGVAKESNNNVSKLPDTGPGSASDQLRKDWNNG